MQGGRTATCTVAQHFPGHGLCQQPTTDLSGHFRPVARFFLAQMCPEMKQNTTFLHAFRTSAL